MAEEQERAFKLQRIYVTDISFESPGAPEVFRQEWKPKMNMQLNNSARRLGESDEYEVEITVTLTAEQDEKTVYLAEVKQAGIFTVKGAAQEEMEQLFGVHCTNILFPYAREAIASLVSRGTFPAFNLQPVNFEALFAQAKASSGNAAPEGDAKH